MNVRKTVKTAFKWQAISISLQMARKLAARNCCGQDESERQQLDATRGPLDATVFALVEQAAVDARDVSTTAILLTEMTRLVRLHGLRQLCAPEHTLGAVARMGRGGGLEGDMAVGMFLAAAHSSIGAEVWSYLDMADPSSTTRKCTRRLHWCRNK